MLNLPKKAFLYLRGRLERFERERAFARAAAEPGKRERLPFRLVYAFRDHAFDLHSSEMALHLLRAYEPVKVIAFGAAERSREHAERTSARLLRDIEEFGAEAVFAFDKLLLPAEVEALKARGVLLAATSDGFLSFDAYVLPQPDAIELLRKLDSYLVAHAPHVEPLRQEGIRAEAFPLWADTDLFRPLPVEKDIDVLFIGTNTGHSRTYRQPLLERISEVAALTVAGPREHFRDLPNARSIGPVNGKEEINLLFNRAKIVIGLDKLVDEVTAANQRVRQKHFYDDVKFQVKDRTTCVMASGACYFVEDHEENRRLFRAGEELVLWSDADDLAAKIQRYLADPVERARIGERARARVVADYSVARRARQLIERLTELRGKS